ncbi:hypothetical protein AUP68_02549 [Ilyonectria robusta]
MSELDHDLFGDQDLFGRQGDAEETNIGMYEAGMDEESAFHVFNVTADQYHRAEALQRTGAIDITCNLEKVVHGAMSADSDFYATLIVMQWQFQPKGSRRISEATITLTFEAGSDDGEVEIEKISFADVYSLMPATQEESVTKGGEATIGVEQIANLSLTGKWEKTVSSATSDAITLSGGKRLVDNKPPNRIATWTLSENESQPAGIPASLKVALLARNDEEKFFCKLDFTCKTDLKTSFQRLFKKIPKDDAIVFQPDPEDKGTHPNKNVTYGDEELGSVDPNDLCDVTFRTLIKNGQKTWK